MKHLAKIVSLLLALTMMLPLFVACGDDGKVSTSTSVSETESKTEKKSETETEKETETLYPAGPEMYIGDYSTVIYVDPVDGDDLGDGSDEDPYYSVPVAYNAAVAAVNAGESDVVIYLRRGTYYMDETMVLDGKSVTNKEGAIHFVGYENPNVGATIATTFDITLDEFESGSQYCDYLVYQFPEESKDEDGNYPAFRNAYIDGEVLSLCRTEENLFVVDSARYASDWAKKSGFSWVSANDHVLYVWASAFFGAATDKDGYFILADEDGNPILDDKYNAIRTTLELHIKTEWLAHTIHVDRNMGNSPYYDASRGEYLVAVHVVDADWDTFKTGYNTIDLGSQKVPYWFESNLAFLDEPGEFYYDRCNGMLYVYPDRTATDESVVSIPLTDRILQFKDMANVTFENINFTGTTMNYITENGIICGQGGQSKRVEKSTGSTLGFLPYGAIYGVNVKNITVDNCRFYNCGSDAINFSGAVEGITVQNSIFENLGGTAVRCGQSTSTYNSTIYNRDIVITNNYIKDIALELLSNTGIFISSAKNVEISCNTIINTPYSAISVGYSWGSQWNGSSTVDTDTFVNLKNVSIKNNYIENFMYAMSDGAAIYTLGANATGRYEQYLNEICGNYFVVYDCISGVGRDTWGVMYGDQGSSHWHYYDNVMVLGDNVEVPHYGYIFFNMGDPTQPYRNLVERTYVVNYPVDHGDKSQNNHIPAGYGPYEEDEIIGWNCVLGVYRMSDVNKKAYLDTTTYDEETGAINVSNIFSKVKSGTKTTDYYDIFTEFYLYHDIDDATDASLAAMESIYDNAGSTLGDKPYGFAEVPVSAEEY